MPEDPTFRPHAVKWTDEKVKRFWDYYSRSPALQATSFAFEVGRDIVGLTRKYVSRDGKNLDYGCGFGALLEYLFEANIPAAGLDSSGESVEKVRERFGHNPLFQGAFLSRGLPNSEIADNTYDFIYFVETIEHILPHQLKAHLNELSRILKKGGHVFVSTPNDEDLSKQEVICPDCGATYHRVQHQASFTEKTLAALMEDAGFETIWCKAALFTQGGFMARIKGAIRRILGAQITPHLLYLGRKP